MSIGVPYMGTKRQLADVVSRLIAECQKGPFLDIFSGMCSVGTAVAPRRQVWSNDLQHFAHWVAGAYFCSEVARPDPMLLAEQVLSRFCDHKNKLMDKFKYISCEEQRFIEKKDTNSLSYFFEKSIIRGNEVDINSEIKEYDLFTSRFGGTYFSTVQSMEIDSIRSSLDNLKIEGIISGDIHRWGVVSLCMAMSRCSTTTGHFAQPLSPKQKNRQKYLNQRRRSIWDEWVRASGEVDAIGSLSWRKRNLTFRNDALQLLSDLGKKRVRPRVIYADPPYTKDQYSRYYHILETAVLYDHPEASGRGLYRGNRATSDFSQSSKVESAIEDLFRLSADLCVDLVVSYPTNGLYKDSRKRIPELASRFYRRPVDVWEFPYAHSTMGGSKGVVRNAVTEVIYRVCN